MSNSRKAGEKLNEPTKEASDAKQVLSQSERNKQIREEIGNDPERLAQRISGVDREKYDLSGFTDKQINMALQGESFGDNDYERLTGKSIGGDAPKEETPEVKLPENTGGGDTSDGGVGDVPKETNYTFMPSIRGPGGGQTIFQDNDQTSSVTGDNNKVVQNQDNSINGYGGNSSWKDAWMKDYFS